MTLLNIIRLCPLTFEEYARRVASHAPGHNVIRHMTKNLPAAEKQSAVLNGGSLYLVMAGKIRCRQLVVGFDSKPCEWAGNKRGIDVDAKIIMVKSTPRRPFQGWQYLTAQDAPVDLPGGAEMQEDEPPPEMARELRDAGLIQ